MKKLILLFAAALVLFSCGGGSKKAQNSESEGNFLTVCFDEQQKAEAIESYSTDAPFDVFGGYAPHRDVMMMCTNLDEIDKSIVEMDLSYLATMASSLWGINLNTEEMLPNMRDLEISEGKVLFHELEGGNSLLYFMFLDGKKCGFAQIVNTQIVKSTVESNPVLQENSFHDAVCILYMAEINNNTADGYFAFNNYTLPSGVNSRIAFYAQKQ